jgi:Uma2 family endonuclease
MTLTYPLHAERDPARLKVADGEIDYPTSDGQPMAENTLQFDWIVLLKENLDARLPCFVGGDLLWYPIQGDNRTRVAPDVMVVPGRPKGYRGSWKQWEEEGLPPAVVIEVLSPGNTLREMTAKAEFYARHGVREFIVVDPATMTGWAALYDEGVRVDDVPDIVGWTSPNLEIRFERVGGELRVIGPDGAPFRNFAEERREAIEARKVAEAEAERANREAERANQEAERAARLAAKLAALGVDPDAP